MPPGKELGTCDTMIVVEPKHYQFVDTLRRRAESEAAQFSVTRARGMYLDAIRADRSPETLFEFASFLFDRDEYESALWIVQQVWQRAIRDRDHLLISYAAEAMDLIEMHLSETDPEETPLPVRMACGPSQPEDVVATAGELILRGKLHLARQLLAAHEADLDPEIDSTRGVVELLTGRAGDARFWLIRAWRAHCEQKNWPAVGRDLFHLGVAAQTVQETELAYGLFRQAYAVFSRSGCQFLAAAAARLSRVEAIKASLFD